MLIIKSQLNNGVNCNINFQKKKDSIVYVLLEISMRLSRKSKTCHFKGFSRRVFSGNLSRKYQVEKNMEFHLMRHRTKSKKVQL